MSVVSVNALTTYVVPELKFVMRDRAPRQPNSRSSCCCLHVFGRLHVKAHDNREKVVSGVNCFIVVTWPESFGAVGQCACHPSVHFLLDQTYVIRLQTGFGTWSVGLPA